MKRHFQSTLAASLLLSLLPGFTLTGSAEVVRPAPDVAFPPHEGRPQSLGNFRGKPLILLFANTPKDGAFREQLKQLEEALDRLTIRSTVFAAAFQSGDASHLNTSVPLVVLPEGAQACAAFQLKGKFAIALIGPDGNLDYQTNKVLNINRILEVMQNSFALQHRTKK